ADLHRLGPRLRDAGGPAIQPHAAAAGRRLLGRRGRLRRIARHAPADLHGGEPDDPDPVAGAGDRPAHLPGVLAGAADLLGGRIVVRFVPGERTDAVVARPQRARVVHAR